MKYSSKKALIEYTGLSKAIIYRLINDNRIKLHNGKILASEMNRVKTEIEKYPSLYDFVQAIKPNDSLFKRKDLDKLVIMLDVNDEIPDDFMIPAAKIAIPYDTKSLYYVNTSLMTQRVKDIITVWLGGVGRTASEKLYNLLSFLSVRYPIFVAEMRRLTDSYVQDENAIKGALAVADALQSVTRSDIPGWTTDILAAYSDRMYGYIQPSWHIWNDFQLQIQEAGYLRSARPVIIDPKQQKVSRGREEYDTMTFALMMQYVFSETSLKHNNLVQKALDNPRYASFWLFVALHFVSAWRRQDYCRVPSPAIQLNPNEIKTMYERGDKSMFYRIADMTDFEIRQLKMKPSKTAKHNPPDLKFYIASSLKETLGLIIAIAATHTSANSPLIATTDFNGNDVKNFFGDEMFSLIGERSFSSLKANRSFIKSVMLSGDEEHGIASGYLLAGLLRAHKTSYHNIPATTQYYLKALETEQLSRDYVVGLLFERGVCGFATQLLLELMYDDAGAKKLSFAEMSDLMAIVHITPLQAEQIILQKQTVEAKANELISMMRIEKITPKEVLTRIAFGVGKNQDGDFCFARAITGRCLNKNRDSCKHCTYEVLTTTMIQKLLTEREVIMRRIGNETSELELKRDHYLLGRVNSDLAEICVTADMLSCDARSDAIADMIERRTQCLHIPLKTIT